MTLNRELPCMRLALPLLLPLVFLASCAGTAADGDPSAMPGADVLRALPPLPPRDAPRLASTPFTTELAGHETTARGGNCVESDIDLFLEPPVGESAWAMYTLSPGGLEVISATVQFFMTNGQAFIALPDYAAGNWRVLVPELAGTFELPLDEDTYSAAGDLYVAILASNGDLIRVTGLQLTVDRPGWTLYDMDTPSTAGNGVDLFVQDGLPMMAYGGKDMSASYLYFARATLPLPTTPGDWRTMLVDFSFSPVDVGPPLAAALGAGRPALACPEEVSRPLVKAFS